MPDVRADSGGSRRWRLPVLMTGITLVGSIAVVRSTVARLHSQACEVRHLRARLAERRREVLLRRRELAAVATAVDSLVPSVRALGSRAMEMCQPTSRIEEGTAPETRVMATLAQVQKEIAEASDAVAAKTVVAGRRSQAARSAPTLWPVEGTVSSPFGWRRSPYRDAWEWHPGIDITAAYGTPVRATADGEVVSAGLERGYGVVVVVKHGAVTTRYAHLSTTWARPGQAVLRGEPLGALGGTGRATAPHLHYEVRIGSEALDPECFLNGPVRSVSAGGRRPPQACALVRARLENPGTPAAAARDAAHTTTPHAGVAG